VSGPIPQPSEIGDEIYRMTQEKLKEGIKLLEEFSALLTAAGNAAAAMLGEWVRARIEEFNQWRDRTLADIGKLVSDLGGRPSDIRKVGDDWTQQVGAAAIAQAQELGREQLPSYGRWKGNAADVNYIGVGIGQVKALEAVRGATNEINESMKAIAGAVTSFWTGIGIGIAALIGGIIAALGASGTIIGIPAGIVLGVGACVAFVALVADAIFSLGNAFNDTRLLTAAENAAPLQAGWPTLASPDVVSDGSTTDGDPSQWQLSS
jgi:hypothetical protein